MFEIHYHPDVLASDFSRLNLNIKLRIKTAIENRLKTHPFDYGKPLSGALHPLWSLRVGDYRVVYEVKKHAVTILQVVDRKDAYQAGILEARRRGIL